MKITRMPRGGGGGGCSGCVSELTEMGESLDWMGLVAEGRAGGEFGWEPQRLGRVRLYYW